jgi:Carbohydrate-binding family 9
MSYTIRKTASAPVLDAGWDSPDWQGADIVKIENFRVESSDHRPVVQAKVLHDNQYIYILFDVQDKYVRCVHTGFQNSVCRDSCVEFFCQPAGCEDYLNFEFSCGGSFLVYHIIDATRTDKGLADYEELTLEDAGSMQIYHTMQFVVEPEITEDTHWNLAARIPLSLFTKYCKEPNGDVSGSTWRANFYKCGDKTSHPHWVSWQPVEVLNFHLPQCFGEVVFE